MFDRAAGQIEPLVKAASLPVNASAAPERKRLIAHPVEHPRSCRTHARERAYHFNWRLNPPALRQTGFQKPQQIAAPEQEARDAGCAGGRDIGLLVANEEACILVDREIDAGAQDHAGSGLTVDMMTTELRDAPFRVIGTVVERIDDGATRGQLVAHPGMQRMHAVLAVVSVRDPGLVGDHDHAVAEIIEPTNCFDRARNPLDLLGPMHIAVIDIENAIAVEEHGRPCVRHRQLRRLTAPVRCPSRDSPTSFRAGSWAGTAGRCGAGAAPRAETASAMATCPPPLASCCPS